MGTGKLESSILTELFTQPGTISVVGPLPCRMPESPSGGPLSTGRMQGCGRTRTDGTETPVSRVGNDVMSVKTQAKRDRREACDKEVWDQETEILCTI